MSRPIELRIRKKSNHLLVRESPPLKRFNFQVYNSPASITALKEPWDRLYQSAPVTSFDSNFEFFLFRLTESGTSRSPLVITGYTVGANEVSLLAAGYVMDLHLTPAFGYLRLGFLAMHRVCLYVPPYGVFGNIDETGAKELGAFFLQTMRARGIDYTYFDLLPSDSPFARHLMRAPGLFVRDRLPHVEKHFTMLLPRAMEEFWARWSNKSRWRLKRIVRDILADFPDTVEVRRFESLDDVPVFCSDAEHIAEHSYLRALDVGFKDSPELRYRKRFEAEKGRFHSYILYLRGQAVAFYSGVRYNQTYFTETLGFDSTYGKYNVGTYLLLRIIEDLCAHPTLRILDFGYGPDVYKERFSTHVKDELRIKLYSGTLDAALLNITVSGTMWATRLLRAVARRVGVYQWVRKYFRAVLWRRYNGQ
jgi:hypothetical protein